MGGTPETRCLALPHSLFAPQTERWKPPSRRQKSMTQYRLLLILSAVAIWSSHAFCQGLDEKQVLVGIGIGQEKPAQFLEIKAISPNIVERAFKSDSPLISRAFVSVTARECCKPAVKVGTHCWRCCDGIYICTPDSQYSELIERSKQVTNEEWYIATIKGLDSIPGWPEIGGLLAKDKPILLEKTDSRVKKFFSEMDK
jgi:hypothetical protein